MQKISRTVLGYMVVGVIGSSCGSDKDSAGGGQGATTAPNEGKIVVSDISSSTATLTWTPFSGSGFTYAAAYSQNEGDVSDKDIVLISPAMRSGEWLNDTDTLSISSLSPGSNYFANILAKSTSGAITLYSQAEFETKASEVPEVPPDAIAASNITATSIQISWTAASDDSTAANDLEYAVFYNSGDALSTYAEVSKSATKAVDFTPNLQAATLTGLTDYTAYHINVAVRDQDGNISLLKAGAATTLDGSGPAAADTTITVSDLASTSLTLSWNVATDNKSAASGVTYYLYSSREGNLDSLQSIRDDGLLVNTYVEEYTINIVSLTSGTTIAFNIIAADEEGNETLYTAVTATTP